MVRMNWLVAVSLLLSAPGVFGFSLEQVAERARERAQAPYSAPKKIPAFLRQLNFEQYQSIRFKPQASLWRGEPTPFEVMLVAPGLFYQHPVEIHVVDDQGLRTLSFNKRDFDFSDPEIEKRIPPDLGFAGFKLTYPFHDPAVQNQFLVFAGASYFRAVGKHNGFGLSARGLAVDTGLPSGEDFPSFVEYWLKKPQPGDRRMEFFALLDSESATGAYRFVVTPGEATKLQVEARLFPRRDVQLLGIAPLTSMFYYGENTPRPQGEWRPRVHDSDGLLIHNGTGEWLWRPLINPKHLQTYYFDTDNVRGFGLLQRQTEFRDYEDFNARYELRPSAWVEPDGDWGRGKVVLVELPSADETSDNVVAFWTPEQKVAPGQTLELAYTLQFGPPAVASEPAGTAQATFVGDGNIVGGGREEGAYRIIVDFGGPNMKQLPADAMVTSSVDAQEGGKVLEHFVEYVEPAQAWRLSILAKPAPGKPLALRAFLKHGADAVTETWTYDLPAADQLRARKD